MRMNNAANYRSALPYLAIALKVACVFFLLAAISWLLAIFWSAHGDWWVKVQTDTTRRVMYAIVRPALSSDVSQAEAQFEFWMFWIPSFAMTTAIFLMVMFARRFYK
jgi:hypothetical protein